MAIQSGLKYLESLGLHVVKPGLERIIKILDYIGNPQNNYGAVLIAGTNGKGSVASILNSIFIHNNIVSGLYTSPHLISVNERISVGNKYISDHDLNHYIKIIKQICDQININLSYFEFLTVISFMYFNDMKVDIAILEVGMGGRWDATNTVNPMISVITNVTYDHMEYLGSTLYEIAEEKAQIIKTKRPVVTACTGESLKCIKSRSESCYTDCYVYNKDFRIKINSKNIMTYRGMQYTLADFKSNLKAGYQLKNIAVSLAVIEIMKSVYKYRFDDVKIKEGLIDIYWPGRFQKIDESRLVLVDCAHNEDAAKVLVSSLKSSYPEKKFYFIIGMLKDKRHERFINIIKNISIKMFLVDGFSERETKASNLADICRKQNIDYEILSDFKNSTINIINSYNPLCITGSVYLVGSVLQMLSKNKNYRDVTK